MKETPVMRLDKLLTALGEGTRAQARDMVRAGRVLVNGIPAGDPGMHVDAAKDTVLLDGRLLRYRTACHVMLNKPAGVLTAARDLRQPTVMELLPARYAAMGCQPAGRLDKDTEGLLILTSDGQLAHRLISPKHDITKVYLARVDGPLGMEDVRAFTAGLHIDDADGTFDARPARLDILSSGEKTSEARVQITEGKYHQVKRMFAARGVRVTYLKRLSIGALTLDAALAPGEWRELTDEEVALLLMKPETGDRHA